MTGDGRTGWARRAFGLVVWVVFLMSLLVISQPVAPGGAVTLQLPGSGGRIALQEAGLQPEADEDAPRLLPRTPQLEASTPPRSKIPLHPEPGLEGPPAPVPAAALLAKSERRGRLERNVSNSAHRPTGPPSLPRTT